MPHNGHIFNSCPQESGFTFTINTQFIKNLTLVHLKGMRVRPKVVVKRRPVLKWVCSHAKTF